MIYNGTQSKEITTKNEIIYRTNCDIEVPKCCLVLSYANNSQIEITFNVHMYICTYM